MNKKNAIYSEHRRRLIEQLTKNIIEATESYRDSSTSEEELHQASEQIAERLQFEANTAVNELVTRFARRRDSADTEQMVSGERSFVRFGRNFRAQHILMFTSVILLIITGIPLKFPEYGLSRFIIVDIFGGLEHSTIVHRFAASGLITLGVWHLGYTLLSKLGRGDFLLMLPRPRDFVDFYETLLYYLGKRTRGPLFGRFSFIEKFDYWAVYWGMVIMIGSGLILWFKELFPRYAFDIAREAHSDEGLLATLAIIVWHFYNVHLNPEVFPMSWVWWHGKLTESELKHHHPLEYAEILENERVRITQQSEELTTGQTSGREI